MHLVHIMELGAIFSFKEMEEGEAIFIWLK
jgi:hypothetical protein